MEGSVPVSILWSSHWEEIRVSERRPERRSNHAAVAFRDRLYVLGGKDMREGVKDSLWVFTPSEDAVGKWEELKFEGAQPQSLCHHTAVLFGDLMVIFGGTDHEVDSDALYLVDLSRLACEKRLPAGQYWPPPMDSHTAVLFGSLMVLFGGFVQGSRSNSLFRLDLTSWMWTELHPAGSTPVARSSHSAVEFAGFMFVLGGVEDGGARLADFWKYDVAANCWTEVRVGSAPSARSGHSACVLGDAMLVFGGYREVAKETNELFRFSFSTSTWHSVMEQTEVADPVRALPESKSPTKRSPPKKSPAESPERKTGSSQRKSKSINFSTLQPVSTIAGRVPHPRDGHSAVVILSKMYVFAGDRGQLPFNDLYVFSQ